MTHIYQLRTGPDKNHDSVRQRLDINNKCELDGSEEEVEVSKDSLCKTAHLTSLTLLPG